MSIIRTLGIDISHWEGLIDWQVASQYVGFAYYKATDGIYFIDSQLGNNMDGCNEAGLAHAAYHYLQPDYPGTAQADHYLDTIEGGNYKREIADCEEPGLKAVTIKAFLDRCELRTARKPAIYTSKGFWDSLNPHPSWGVNYDLLVANYRHALYPVLPTGLPTWKIWQNTVYFWVPGCDEIADGNWFNGPMEAARAWFGNYRQVIPPGDKKIFFRSYFAGLHIRQSPSVLAREVGHLDKNEIVQLKEVGGQDVWIEHERGWSAVERDEYRYMELIKNV